MERRQPSELTTDPDNPRVISNEALEDLKDSIERDDDFFEARPIIADPDGQVIAGNQRLRAARDLDMESVPVHVIEPEDDEHRRRIRLLDNVSYGTWETEVFQEEYDEAELDDWGAQDIDLPT